MAETESTEDPQATYPWAGSGRRWAGALLVALAYGLACYFLVDLVRPDSGYFYVSFAILQPAVLCAFVAFVGDPKFRREGRYYKLVPLFLLLGMVVISLAVLREGTVCVIMLAPIWYVSGLTGTMLLEWLRKRAGDGGGKPRVYAPGILALPLVILPIEASLPVPEAHQRVERSVIIDAPAQAIWPLMQGMGDIQPDEGKTNFSQDVVGLPRPLEARLEGRGVGARREGYWENGVHFAEVVDRWRPEREIGWAFDFSDSGGWEFTDVHLHPASEHMQIVRGGYRLDPLADGRQRLTLHTDYVARTHLNPYAMLWGELFLGDISANLLTTIRDRAEGRD
ncbi:SRPBCC family protein [Alteriqipengyuania lutimaris]|uniref:SRPBCC family protein n=1 Tax=Alteriqipengyuania lutimaris TaxID=1538146 RepID=UPI001CFE1155|nr:SRPBCC family protein [Alteriqipengyuania lutimaris]